jgi:hypothetical protein
MHNKFSLITSRNCFHTDKKVKLSVPVLAATFLFIGAGFSLSTNELVVWADSSASNKTVNAGSANDGKVYSDNWRLNNSNNWEYFENGKKVTNAWVHDHDQWYLLGESGEMKTGLYQSYGKYYLLDNIRGTGTYGKLLKNGGTYKGVVISADTSADYEGALSEDTLNNLAGVGIIRDDAVNVTGTAHNTDEEYTQSNNTTNNEGIVQNVIQDSIGTQNSSDGLTGEAAVNYISNELAERDKSQLEMAKRSGLTGSSVQ